jgi:glyoxylase I family protein
MKVVRLAAKQCSRLPSFRLRNEKKEITVAFIKTLPGFTNQTLAICLLATATGGSMIQAKPDSLKASTGAVSTLLGPQSFVVGFWGVRYQVKDVKRSVSFYTQQLGFKLDRQYLPPFGQVSLGNLKLLLSGLGASGSRRMPDGSAQEPGGWNRLVLEVAELPARIAELQKAGLQFRNQMEAGPGGRQIQVQDPDGNPIELFEPSQ